MNKTTLDLLACPQCRSQLVFAGTPERSIPSGQLTCSNCSRFYPIANGIPHFVASGDLNGLNKRFARLYDRFAWAYTFFLKAAYALIGVKEETARREITDRLEPRGGKVLEVSIGPGVNLPYLVSRPDVGEIYGLDISLNQLTRCQRFAANHGWQVELMLANAEQLPLKDNSFESVFHVGGINFFNDRKSAVEEMIRVAKPGARILIADETEEGARGYERVIPSFRKQFNGAREPVKAPVDLVPVNMLELQVHEIWKGWMYCVEFRKPW